MAARASAPSSAPGLGRREPCAKCSLPVFLAERLHVGTKMYHRTCFRCARCKTQLSLANCYETETDGVFCCETCPDEEPSPKSDPEPPLSDEQKSETRDDYSANFESALESTIAKSRQEWSSGMLQDNDSDDIDVVTADMTSKNLESCVTLVESKDVAESSEESVVEDLKVHEEKSEVLVESSPSNQTCVASEIESRGSFISEMTLAVQTYEDPPKRDPDEETIMNASTTDIDPFPTSQIRIPGFKDASFGEDPIDPPSLPKTDPPDPASLATSVNSVNTDSDTASDVLTPIVTKESSLVQSRRLLFENPSMEKPYRNSSTDTIDTSIPETSPKSFLIDKEIQVKKVGFIAANDRSPVPAARTGYPDQLNPFEDDEDDGGMRVVKPSLEDLKGVGSGSLNGSGNPFEDEEDEENEEEVELRPKPMERKVVKAPVVSLNPFWSDGEEPSDEEGKPVPLPRKR